MASASQSQEFVVRAPKNTNTIYGIVKFNPNNKVDFTTSETVKIERENNFKDYKAAYDMDVMPKFGAGSEFGREEREEARRKKYGIHRRRYNVDDQPWLLKLGSGKSARKFKGTKEGGILENASYYIFTQCSDGAFDAFPVKDWHTFNPVIKYKHLNIDEAEEEYTRRDKTLNYFNIMVKKRVKGTEGEGNDKDDEEDKQKNKKKKKKKGKDFLLTDMDDWALLSDDENDDSDDGRRQQSDSDESTSSKKKGKQRRKTKKDYKTNSGDEAIEESDDADEGREVDYMTDTDSDDEDMYENEGRNKLDKYKQTGVEDEEGLQKIIESDDENEAEEEKKESENEASADEDKGSQSSSGSSSDSDSDPDKDTTALFMQKKDPVMEKKERDRKEKEKKKLKKDKKDKKEKSGRKRRNSESSEASNITNSRSGTPTILTQSEKREDSHIAKRAKMETPPISGTEGLTEDMVRRYLMRKPMTTGALMKKFKNLGLPKEKLAINITEILNKVNPEKKTIDGKLHLWIKKTE